MLKILLENKVKLAWSALIVAGFVLIRAFEDELFYDPFLEYFKRDYFSMPYPQTDNVKLLINLLFRFVLNSALSLALIQVLFRNSDTTKFAAMLYGVGFMLFLLAFVAFWKEWFGEQKMLLFYARRFLIQPLLTLLFVPAFYFQERMEKNNNS